MFQEEDDNNEGIMAVLRSDLPTPALRLWDATLNQNIVPEYADYTEQTLLHAQLIGRMCLSQIALAVETEELASLVASLRTVNSLSVRESAWATYHRELEFRLVMRMEKLGPPVECDVWLRDAIVAREEHHCRFETNLAWVTTFLAAVERMAFRYRRARIYLGESC